MVTISWESGPAAKKAKGKGGKKKKGKSGKKGKGGRKGDGNRGKRRDPVTISRQPAARMVSLGTVPVAADGTTSLTFLVPERNRPGGHRVEGQGSAGSHAAATFEVSPGSAGTASVDRAPADTGTEEPGEPHVPAAVLPEPSPPGGAPATEPAAGTKRNGGAKRKPGAKRKAGHKAKKRGDRRGGQHRTRAAGGKRDHANGHRKAAPRKPGTRRG